MALRISNLENESQKRAEQFAAGVGGYSFNEGALNAKRQNILSLSLIQPDPEQPRKNFSEEEAKELEASIKKHGVLQPIIVRENPKNSKEYLIIAGERRWRAASAAGLKEIPAIIREQAKTESTQAIQLTENIIRADLSAMEIAETLNKMVSGGEAKKGEIANELGKSQAWVTRHLALLTLPKPLRELYDDGRLTDAARLYDLSRQWDKFPTEIAQWIESDDFHAGKIHEFLGSLKKGATEKNPPPKSTVVASEDVVEGNVAKTVEEVPQSVKKGISDDLEEKDSPRKSVERAMSSKVTIKVLLKRKKGNLLYWYPQTSKGKGWIKLDGEIDAREVPLSELSLVSIEHG